MTFTSDLNIEEKFQCLGRKCIRQDTVVLNDENGSRLIVLTAQCLLTLNSILCPFLLTPTNT